MIARLVETQIWCPPASEKEPWPLPAFNQGKGAPTALTLLPDTSPSYPTRLPSWHVIQPDISINQNTLWSTCNVTAEQLVLKQHFWSYSYGICKRLNLESLSLLSKGSVSTVSSALKSTLLCGWLPPWLLSPSQRSPTRFVILRILKAILAKV